MLNIMMTISPKITHIAWGEMEVEGLGIGKDFKLYPGGGRAWDWSETNTQHVPGIQPDDVKELIENGAKELVLSRGMLVRLQVCPETEQYLEKAGVEFHVMETKLAVELYNHLASQNLKVGGLFHSTC
jgi:hypothetical protein